MNIPIDKRLVCIKDRHNLVKLYFYIHYVHVKGLGITDCELDIMSYLFIQGGYNNKIDCDKFLEGCVDRGYKRSIQSVRNSLSKLTSLKLLGKSNNNNRVVLDVSIPREDIFGLEYFITNLDVNNSSDNK